MWADLFKINYVEKEVEHEIEFAISERKYQLTILILEANILANILWCHLLKWLYCKVVENYVNSQFDWKSLLR